jgi:hypothetical protein
MQSSVVLFILQQGTTCYYTFVAKKEVPMSDYKTTWRPFPYIFQGFAHGLAQMSGMGRSHSLGRFPKSNSAVKSLRGDWMRLGGDMAVAIEKVRERGAEKSKPET